MLVSLFGALAVVLAGAGLYGVLAYLVAQRRHEIGIRLALGASGRRVARAVLLRGLGLAAAGGCLGTLAALAASRLAASSLFGIEPWDLVSFAAAPLLLLAVAALAGLHPARRAGRVDPLESLRQD